MVPKSSVHEFDFHVLLLPLGICILGVYFSQRTHIKQSTFWFKLSCTINRECQFGLLGCHLRIIVSFDMSAPVTCVLCSTVSRVSESGKDDGRDKVQKHQKHQNQALWKKTFVIFCLTEAGINESISRRLPPCLRW